MVSTVGNLMAGIDRHQAANQERIDQIKDYTKWREFPRPLALRVRRYHDGLAPFTPSRSTVRASLPIALLINMCIPSRVCYVHTFTTLPSRLCRYVQVRHFYEYYYRRVPAFDEATILEEMTPQLRLEATTFLLQKSVGAMPLFARAAPEFQMHVYPRLRPRAVSVGDVIYKRGDISRHLYFLLKGEVNVLAAFDSRPLFQVTAVTVVTVV